MPVFRAPVSEKLNIHVVKVIATVSYVLVSVKYETDNIKGLPLTMYISIASFNCTRLILAEMIGRSQYGLSLTMIKNYLNYYRHYVIQTHIC